MTKKIATKKTIVIKRLATQFRFLDDAHHALVTKAAKTLGLSLNAWIVQATLKQAREELNISI